MKSLVFIISNLFLMATLTAAHSDQYETAMKKAIQQYDSVKTFSEFQDLANTFERISLSEDSEWLPNYYAGLTYIYMSYGKGLEADERDEFLEKAEYFYEKANEISENNVEIAVLIGYIKMAKLSVNPGVRGIYMSQQVSGLFDKALKLDPNNPRANIMHARWKYGMAEFFNSSTDEACMIVYKAAKLFEAQTEEGIAPLWGMNMVNSMKKACSQSK